MKIKWSELHPNRLYKHLEFDKPNKRREFDTKDEELNFKVHQSLMRAWVLNGKNVFVIDGKLISMLSKTDVNNINVGELQLPYMAFYIHFEDSDTTPFIVGVRHFEGVYVLYTPKTGISIGYAQKRRTGVSMFHFNTTDPNTSFADIINKASSSELFELLNKSMPLIVNTLLYISLPKADIKKEYTSDVPTGFTDRLKKAQNKTQKETAERRIKDAGYSIVHLVGNSFTKQHLTNDETRSVSTHWRRGHWRNQPYGENQTKLIWIMPVIVNADKGEPAKGHIYK